MTFPPFQLTMTTASDVGRRTGIQYSLFKIGDKERICWATDLFERRVKTDINRLPQGTPFVISYVPTFVRNNALFYVCSALTRRMGIQQVKLSKRTHSFGYQAQSAAEREKLDGETLCCDRLLPTGTHVFLFDDAFVTGKMLTQAVNAIRNAGAASVQTYVVTRIQTPDPSVEYAMERSFLSANGPDAFVNLLNNRRSVFTGFWITILATMPDNEFEYTKSRLSEHVKARVRKTWRTFLPGSPLSNGRIANI